MNSENQATNPNAYNCSVNPQKQVETFRTSLDAKIKEARERVERLCITKAKMEALGVLDHDTDLYMKAHYL